MFMSSTTGTVIASSAARARGDCGAVMAIERAPWDRAMPVAVTTSADFPVFETATITSPGPSVGAAIRG